MNAVRSSAARRGAPVRALAAAFLVLAGFAALTAPVRAQDGPHPLAVRGDSLRADLERMTVEFDELHESLGELSGKDSLVTAQQARELLFEGIDRIYDMADNVAAQEKEGLDAGDLRGYVEGLLDRVPTALRASGADTEAEIRRLQETLETADPADLVLLEEEIAAQEERFDSLGTVALRYLDALEELGRDTSELRAEWSESLTRRVELSAGRLKLASEQRERLAAQADASPDNTELADRAEAADLAVEAAVASLQRRVDLMDGLDLDTSEYRTLLVETTGEIARGLDARVASRLARAWAERGQEWIVRSGPGLLAKLFVVLVILVAFRFLSRLVRRAVMRAIDSSKLRPSQLLRKMIENTVGNLIMALGILVALSQIGVSLGPLLAGFGVAGIVIGFALQETLANFASGMMILFYRPFDVGDYIEAAGVSGTVHAMSLVSTTILTFDNQTLIVPNGKIWGDVIRNVTHQHTRRVDLVAGISYDADIPRAEEVLMGVLRDHPKVLDDPEPTVRVHELGDSSVNLNVRPWVKTEDYWDVYWDVTRAIKLRLDEAGVGIPYPQRDVHHYYPEGPPRGAGGPSGPPGAAGPQEPAAPAKPAGDVTQPPTKETGRDFPDPA